jgi:hypothetical protein
VFSKNVNQFACDKRYPCPCRRQANLVPIFLTDAFGCDRCPQVFVMDDDGRLVEQLTASYPYARTWRWTGQQWKAVRPKHDGYVVWFLTVLVLWTLGWVFGIHAYVPALSGLYWAIGVFLITFVLPTVHYWFIHRR